MIFWLRYWWHFRRSEQLGPLVPFLVRQLRVDRRNRENDRIKYA